MFIWLFHYKWSSVCLLNGLAVSLSKCQSHSREHLLFLAITVKCHVKVPFLKLVSANVFWLEIMDYNTTEYISNNLREWMLSCPLHHNSWSTATEKHFFHIKLLTEVVSPMCPNHLNLDMWVFFRVFCVWFTDYSLTVKLLTMLALCCLNGVCGLVSLKNTRNRKTSL